MKRLFIVCFLLVAVSVGTGCGAMRPVERGVSRLIIPASTEAQLGASYAAQIEQEIPLLNDAETQAWLEEMGQRLVAHSPNSPQEFRFAVAASRDVNAFAIPGGYCYVNLGLLLYADNEAQVAAVMGHEVNHVTRRHGILRLQRAMGLQLATYGVSALFRSDMGRAAALLAGTGTGYVATQQFSQQDELEADRDGVLAMYEAGWDPREAAAFFQKLADLQAGYTPSWLESFMATHPATERRIERINAMVAEMDLSRPLVVNTPRFEAIQTRLREQYGD